MPHRARAPLALLLLPLAIGVTALDPAPVRAQASTTSAGATDEPNPLDDTRRGDGPISPAWVELDRHRDSSRVAFLDAGDASDGSGDVADTGLVLRYGDGGGCTAAGRRDGAAPVLALAALGIASVERRRRR